MTDQDHHIPFADLFKTYRGQQDVETPSDELLQASYGAFRKAVVPQWKAILDLVKRKGSDFPRQFSYRSPLPEGLTLTFQQMKVPTKFRLSNLEGTEVGTVSISNGGFYQVGFKLLENDEVVVYDGNVEEPIRLDAPDTLLTSIPSSRLSPVGNSLIALGYVVPNLDSIQDKLAQMPDLR